MKILVLLLFLQSIALGIDVKVIYVKGDVKKVDLDGKVKNLVKGDVLIEGYTVKTSADSYALLKIDGHSNHRVEENSEVMIEELPYNFENSKELEQGGSVIIQVGTIFSEITSRADIPTFQVKTKNTVMGVRGTEFMASVLENSEDVFLTVKKGEVEVQNAFSDFHDVVNVNETIVIEKDTKSTQQRRHEWTEKLQWDLSATNFEKGKRFAQVRKEALEAHKQKRKPWVRNELRFNKRWIMNKHCSCNICIILGFNGPNMSWAKQCSIMKMKALFFTIPTSK